ncbi:MAG: hypothetical protein RQ745_12745, partial [Longimicrobiales bacterium]|nr:hypothetical protein [Longimicrobiales bacterium]
EILAADPAPAIPLSQVVEEARRRGAPSSPELLRHELAPGRGALRTIEGASAALAAVADACPPHLRPPGLEALVLESGDGGLRPTARDAVRVLARALDPGDVAARARWSRLLEGVAALPR